MTQNISSRSSFGCFLLSPPSNECKSIFIIASLCCRVLLAHDEYQFLIKTRLIDANIEEFIDSIFFSSAAFF
jgi:hypothetical protein